MFEECLYFNATKFTRFISSLWDEAYRPVGLSPSHAYLLMFILDRPGETPKKLAERMGLKLSTISRLIDKLFIKGFVVRRKSNKDQRECCIYPTKTGVYLSGELEEITNKLHINIRKILGDEGTSNAIESLKKITDKINVNNRGS